MRAWHEGHGTILYLPPVSQTAGSPLFNVPPAAVLTLTYWAYVWTGGDARAAGRLLARTLRSKLSAPVRRLPFLRPARGGLGVGFGICRPATEMGPNAAEPRRVIATTPPRKRTAASGQVRCSVIARPPG
jgi:hypothetical protein